jgi:uncharacterized protein (TIGR02284 family)
MPQPIAYRSAPRQVAIALNDCIEICTDGEKGYAIAAADVRHPGLKMLFQERSKERAEFVVALQAVLWRLGAYAENQGTAQGAARRGWMDVRLALEGQKDRIIVEEWVRGEQAAVNGFRKVFTRTPLDTFHSDVRRMLAGQYAAMQTGLGLARRQLTVTH